MYILINIIITIYIHIYSNNSQQCLSLPKASVEKKYILNFFIIIIISDIILIMITDTIY